MMISERKVSRMVYCKLIENKGDSAVYQIGASVDDMTGKVVFYRESKEPTLLKQADEDPVRTMHLARIVGKYSKDFVNGIFAEKLAYEIG